MPTNILLPNLNLSPRAYEELLREQIKAGNHQIIRAVLSQSTRQDMRYRLMTGSSVNHELVQQYMTAVERAGREANLYLNRKLQPTSLPQVGRMLGSAPSKRTPEYVGTQFSTYSRPSTSPLGSGIGMLSQRTGNRTRSPYPGTVPGTPVGALYHTRDDMTKPSDFIWDKAVRSIPIGVQRAQTLFELAQRYRKDADFRNYVNRVTRGQQPRLTYTGSGQNYLGSRGKIPLLTPDFVKDMAPRVYELAHQLSAQGVPSHASFQTIPAKLVQSPEVKIPFGQYKRRAATPGGWSERGQWVRDFVDKRGRFVKGHWSQQGKWVAGRAAQEGKSLHDIAQIRGGGYYLAALEGVEEWMSQKFPNFYRHYLHAKSQRWFRDAVEAWEGGIPTQDRYSPMDQRPYFNPRSGESPEEQERKGPHPRYKPGSMWMEGKGVEITGEAYHKVYQSKVEGYGSRKYLPLDWGTYNQATPMAGDHIDLPGGMMMTPYSMRKRVGEFRRIKEFDPDFHTSKMKRELWELIGGIPDFAGNTMKGGFAWVDKKLRTWEFRGARQAFNTSLQKLRAEGHTREQIEYYKREYLRNYFNLWNPTIEKMLAGEESMSAANKGYLRGLGTSEGDPSKFGGLTPTTYKPPATKMASYEEGELARTIGYTSQGEDISKRARLIPVGPKREGDLGDILGGRGMVERTVNLQPDKNELLRKYMIEEMGMTPEQIAMSLEPTGARKKRQMMSDEMVVRDAVAQLFQAGTPAEVGDVWAGLAEQHEMNQPLYEELEKHYLYRINALQAPQAP